MLPIITIIILILSVVVHEVSHGFAADWLGDPTPRLQGRLTLNPIKHLDPIGSVLLPLLMVLSHTGFVFGWAKPVEYNPYNIRNKRRGEILIALAGPASNILLATVFSLIIRGVLAMNGVVGPFIQVCAYVVLINITLAIFNLIPIPPLDGSKIFLSLLPNQYGPMRMFLEKYSMILLLVVVLFLWKIIAPIVPALFTLLTGVGI
jgi:Zn-dependent protease